MNLEKGRGLLLDTNLKRKGRVDRRWKGTASPSRRRCPNICYFNTEWGEGKSALKGGGKIKKQRRTRRFLNHPNFEEKLTLWKGFGGKSK